MRKTAAAILATVLLGSGGAVAMTADAAAAAPGCQLSEPTLTPARLVIDRSWGKTRTMTVAVTGADCSSEWAAGHTLFWYSCSDLECWGSVPMRRAGDNGSYTWTSPEPINAQVKPGTYQNGVWAIRGSSWMNDPLDAQLPGPDLEILRDARFSTNAGPEPISKGKKLTITGTLDRLRWDPRGSKPDTYTWAGYGGRKVELQFRTSAGSYTTLTTGRTNTLGQVSYAAPATQDGCYRWVYRGNTATVAATSKADCVDVT